MSMKDVLKSCGYVEISTRGKCKYYVKAGEKYAVAIAIYKDDEFEIIVENDVFRELGYPSIWISKKNSKMFVPCIQVGSGRHMHIHNLLLQDEWCVDHINHNRFFCVTSNVRSCNSEANAMNSARAVGIKESNWGYWFRLTLQTKARYAVPKLMKDGFKKIEDIGTWCVVESPVFQSKVDCYLRYRDYARELYKGTGMEDFVYDIENDFSETIDLLISHYILGDITEEEMHKKNLDFWRDKLDNAPALQMVV